MAYSNTYKKVLKEYEPPVRIEFLSTDSEAKLVEVIPVSTHRKKPVYVYQYSRPKFIKVGKRKFANPKFGQRVNFSKENILLFNHDRVKLYYENEGRGK